MGLGGNGATELMFRKLPIILQDNARAHTADAVEDLLRRRRWVTLEHPPYSPGMSPCDYDLFAPK
jgi:transposase